MMRGLGGLFKRGFICLIFALSATWCQVCVGEGTAPGRTSGILAGPKNETRAWEYPGIPYTDWEYDPFTRPAPSRPASWPNADQVGYYFIEKDHPNATDTVDSADRVDANGRRFGYPGRPRRTLPLTGWNSTKIRPGSVLWIRGGEWDSHYGGFLDWFAQWEGTAAQPCWIFGDPEKKPVFKDLRIGFSGPTNQHVFVENIIWDKWTTRNSSSVTIADGAHHIVVRRCIIRNRDYMGKHGSHISVVAGPTAGTQDCHNLVFYDIDFKNNGRAVDWRTQDADYHGFKLDGIWNGGRSYRIWIVGCHLFPGDTPDPVDGLKKSITGSFVQIGDQLVTRGNVDHVYVAGNVVQYQRQVTIGCKRCADVIGSGNVSLKGSTFEPMFNTKYDRQDHLWFIANHGQGQGSLLARKELTAGGAGGPDTHLPENSRVYVIGNILRDSTGDEQSGGIGEWKRQGIAFEDMRGKTFIVNNTMDNTIYGVVTAQNSRLDDKSEIHIYNNIFFNMAATVDPNGGRSIMISKFYNTTADQSLKVYMENNLMDDMKVYLHGSPLYVNPTQLNSLPFAKGNLEGPPMFSNAGRGDYRLQRESPARDAGTTSPVTNPSASVYQQFVDRYRNDPDFPDDPERVLPFDILMQPRINGTAIDCGAHEFNPGQGAPATN